MSTYEFILVERHENTVRITMNAPRRNALSTSHLAELCDAFERTSREDAAGIVLGAEGPAFCSGHDFTDVLDGDLASARELLTRCIHLMQLIQSAPQVVIGRVHSLATAAGCQLVASCDLAIAGESARFALPGGQGGWFCHTPAVPVARNIGRKRLMEMALTGDSIDAGTAASWGLVNRVVPDSRLDDAVDELLTRATRGSRSSKAIGKQTLYAHLDRPEVDAYAIAAEVMAATSLLPAAREGFEAFLQKRPPSWVD